MYPVISFFSRYLPSNIYVPCNIFFSDIFQEIYMCPVIFFPDIFQVPYMDPVISFPQIPSKYLICTLQCLFSIRLPSTLYVPCNVFFPYVFQVPSMYPAMSFFPGTFQVPHNMYTVISFFQISSKYLICPLKYFFQISSKYLRCTL